MLKMFINLYCKMHLSAKANDTTCQNPHSGPISKINVTKNRFFWCISYVKGTLKKIHCPGNFLLTKYNLLIYRAFELSYSFPNLFTFFGTTCICSSCRLVGLLIDNEKIDLLEGIQNV